MKYPGGYQIIDLGDDISTASFETPKIIPGIRDLISNSKKPKIVTFDGLSSFGYTAMDYVNARFMDVQYQGTTYMAFALTRAGEDENIVITSAICFGEDDKVFEIEY